MKIQNEIIRSRQNPTVKWAASLVDKKGRESAKSFLAEGWKLTLEAATSDLLLTHVFVMESKREQMMPKIREAFASSRFDDTVCLVLSDEAFLKISTEKAPQGVISVIKYLDFFKELDIIYYVGFHFDYNEKILALSSVRDPSNLGSVIRSAAAFGVEHVLLSADCADPYNPKAVRSAMGALFRVRITRVNDLRSAVLSLKEDGRRVLAAELREGARSVAEIGLASNDVVVIGNEGHGIDEAVSLACSHSVYIPISRATESLNAAVAAAIFMWEISKT